MIGGCGVENGGQKIDILYGHFPILDLQRPVSFSPCPGGGQKVLFGCGWKWCGGTTVSFLDLVGGCVMVSPNGAPPLPRAISGNISLT